MGPALVLLAVLGACSGGRVESGRPAVVATVSPITNLIENVAGSNIEITGLVPEGVNSHTFEPAPSDARVLSRAGLLFMNGFELEEPTLELARATLPKEAEVVALAEVTLEELEEDPIFDFSFPRSGGHPNPHLWTNPPYARRFAEVIRDRLAGAHPAGAERYRRNAADLAERIDALDRALRVASATVPGPRRKLLTYHDSFPYFAREYGWEVVGAIQPSDFSEPTPRDVADLIQQIQREKVPAIFGSEVFPSPVLEQIARETGARYVDDLRDDDLPGEPGNPGHSYLGMMTFDFSLIVESLGGDASALERLDTSNVVDGDARYR
ncbi:MAG: metal ABC transporter substrate-binding protein [Actinomycetota bacterium]